METTQAILFVVASLAVILTPGQDFLLVMSRAVSQGSRAGVVTAAGVSAGLLGHSTLAALGLGALLLASASLFTVLKTIGALYLFYLGTRLIFSKSRRLELEGAPAGSTRRYFFSGAISNISNPHVTLFYFAFLPQFIPATAERPTLSLLLLGISFALLTFLIKGPVGYFAGRLSGWLRTHPQVVKWIDRTSGAMLIGLGCRLALDKQG